MKPTLTIAITAYNEAENIAGLLSTLLHQTVTSADLRNILVVSDASTDNTDGIVRSFKGRGVELVRVVTRGGSIRARNMILTQTDTDILIILDADILPEADGFVDALIGPLIADPLVGLTSATLQPMLGQTFVERILCRNHEWKRALFLSLGDGNNLYSCFGPVQAFSRRFYATFRYQDDTPYDAIAYLSCIASGMRFVVVRQYSALFRCPTNFRDHVRQSSRFSAGRNKIIEIFGDEGRRAYAIPVGRMVLEVIKEFFRRPILSMSYFAMWLYVRLFKKSQFTSLWEVAESSKKLTV